MSKLKEKLRQNLIGHLSDEKTELDVNLLKIIPVKGFPIQSKWSLIWLKDKKLSIAAQAYIEYIKNEKLNIIDSKFGWCDQYN
jgi:hypothetical protein